MAHHRAPVRAWLRVRKLRLWWTGLRAAEAVARSAGVACGAFAHGVGRRKAAGCDHLTAWLMRIAFARIRLFLARHLNEGCDLVFVRYPGLSEIQRIHWIVAQ